MENWCGIVIGSDMFNKIWTDTEKELIDTAFTLVSNGLAVKVILGCDGSSYGYIDANGYHSEKDY